MRTAPIAILTLSFLALLGSTPGVPAKTLHKPPDLGTAWASDWSAKRLDHILTLYTADAVFFTSEGRYAGTLAIRDLFRKTLEVNSPTIRMHRLVAEQSGNLAYESGEFQETIVSSESKRESRGQYIFVLRKEGRRWLIVEQMWTETTGVSR